jgi:hypothetical protein
MIRPVSVIAFSFAARSGIVAPVKFGADWWITHLAPFGSGFDKFQRVRGGGHGGAAFSKHLVTDIAA